MKGKKSLDNKTPCNPQSSPVYSCKNYFQNSSSLSTHYLKHRYRREPRIHFTQNSGLRSYRRPRSHRSQLSMRRAFSLRYSIYSLRSSSKFTSSPLLETSSRPIHSLKKHACAHPFAARGAVSCMYKGYSRLREAYHKLESPR
jgi:hypothetical protein